MDAGALGVDYLTIAGHKFYGPRMGALYVKGLEEKATPLVAMMYGSGQERGYRSGYVCGCACMWVCVCGCCTILLLILCKRIIILAKLRV